jgi:carboxymethylenebutenolidase
MSDVMTTRMVMFDSADGTSVQGYLASPEGLGPRGGVIVLHHLPGFDRATREITRRIAVLGYDALMINLYWREAPTASPDDASAVVRAMGGVPDKQVVDDAAGAAAYLRALASSNGRVGTIGYCSGGRQSVLVGCHVDVDAVVDCYGAYVTGIPIPEFPLKVTNLVDQLPGLRAPLMGMFGNDDQFPSPAEVDELDEILTRLGKAHELVRFDNAAHAFFFSDRDSYRVHAAVEGWERIAGFYAQHLGA